MEEIEAKFNQIENKLLTVLESNIKLRQEVVRLGAELRNLETKNREISSHLRSLEEENKNIKVVSAISGNEEYKNLMKLQLNKLIKEIDLCIMEVKSN